MTATFLLASSSLVTAVLHGAALGGLIAAGVLMRARVHGWNVDEPWAITAAWSVLGACMSIALLIVSAVV